MRRIYHIVVKEFLQIRRDKKMLVVSIVVPVVQLILLGYAATMDVKNIPMLLVDMDKSSISREFISQFSNSGYFVIHEQVNSPAEIDKYIENGEVWIAVVIPSTFSKNVMAGRQTAVQLIADGSDANSANIGIGYASQIIATYSRRIMGNIETQLRSRVAFPRINTEIRVWYNPELKSRNFMVPGVLALILMVITLMLTSLGIVKEKEIGTLEQLMVTPIKPYQLIIGKLLPFVIIATIDILLVISVAYWWFGVALRGSFFLLLGLSGLFILTTLGLGLFVSTVSKTQQQAMMTAMFFIFLPLMFFSGFAFPIENMPRIIQYVSYLLPLRYYLVIVRGLFLKGVGITELWTQAAALLAFGALILTLSVLRFKKTLN
jgi:ABC-2 type transport system permease protein